MQTTLIYRFDEEDDTTLEAVKITAHTVTIRGVGTQARMAKLATAQWRAELTPAAVVTSTINAEGEVDSVAATISDLPVADENDPEQIVKYNAFVRWATCAAGTGSVAVIKRTKKSRELDTDLAETWPWEPSSLAALGWDKPEGVLDIKTDLFDAWEKAVQNANPGVFGKPLTSTAKKKTGVIATT